MAIYAGRFIRASEYAPTKHFLLRLRAYDGMDLACNQRDDRAKKGDGGPLTVFSRDELRSRTIWGAMLAVCRPAWQLFLVNVESPHWGFLPCFLP